MERHSLIGRSNDTQIVWYFRYGERRGNKENRFRRQSPPLGIFRFQMKKSYSQHNRRSAQRPSAPPPLTARAECENPIFIALKRRRAQSAHGLSRRSGTMFFGRAVFYFSLCSRRSRRASCRRVVNLAAGWNENDSRFLFSVSSPRSLAQCPFSLHAFRVVQCAARPQR